MLTDRKCPHCGGHLCWMRLGEREQYRCEGCHRQMTEREVEDCRRNRREVATDG